MKTKKRIALVLLLVHLVSLFAGCGNSGATTTETTKEYTPQGEVITPVAEAGEVSLPLVDELTTLTIWGKPNTAFFNLIGNNYNDSVFFQELEKRTNVHIEWIIPASGSERDQLNLLIASGDLPDIIYQTSDAVVQYNTGLDAAVDDGYFMDLTDLLKQYAPNYLAAVEAGGSKVQKGVVTDKGRYVIMPSIQAEEQPPFMGYMVRKDWLDDLGLDIPVTYADWENMLTKFKEEKGAIAPLALIENEIWGLGGAMDAYGSNFYQVDGKVYYGLYSNPEENKAYLTMLNDWYTKGLIDPDFASSTSWISGDTVMVTTGKTGVFQAMYTQPAMEFLPSMEEGAALTAINAPVNEAGQQLKYRQENQYMASGYCISTQCENPELAVRWLDYLYSEEGWLFCNYGIEGVSYTLDAEGNPQYTDLILNNPDGLTPGFAVYNYCMPAGSPAYQSDWRVEKQYTPAESVAFMEVWNEVSDAYYIPQYVSMSADENSEYSNLYADIESYVNENVLQFITGEKSMDEYDAFIDILGTMGIDRCIELKQAALDRYNNR